MKTSDSGTLLAQGTRLLRADASEASALPSTFWQSGAGTAIVLTLPSELHKLLVRIAMEMGCKRFRPVATKLGFERHFSAFHGCHNIIKSDRTCQSTKISSDTTGQNVTSASHID